MKRETLNKILWFIGLWIGGVLAIAAIAYAFKLLAMLAIQA